MLKNLIFILSILLLATSCSTMKSSTAANSPASRPNVSSSAEKGTQSNSSIQFINNIAIKSDAHRNETGSSISTPMASIGNNGAMSGAGIENYSSLQFKYAILENATVEEVNNPKLLTFMDYWYGTPYHYGGSSRDGIDCSAFSFLLMSSVYGIAALPRTSKEQYEATRRIHRDQLQEGDLVFFHTLGKRRMVTHVGIYLRNNKFIHASVSGVMISDMNDGYYDKHFIGAGRILSPSGAPLPDAGQSGSSPAGGGL